VFFEKIMNDFFHDLQLGLSGFIDADPNAALKSTVEIRGDLQPQFDELLRVFN